VKFSVVELPAETVPVVPGERLIVVPFVLSMSGPWSTAQYVAGRPSGAPVGHCVGIGPDGRSASATC
jgi:hypothetical protein